MTGIVAMMASRPGAGGGGGAAVHLSDRTWTETDNGTSGTPSPTANAGYELNLDGYVYQSLMEGASPTWANTGYAWLSSGSAGDYDVRFTKVSGATLTMTGSATLATWLNLATTRLIGYTSNNTSATGTFTVEIAASGDHATILASATVILTATATDFAGATAQLSNKTWSASNNGTPANPPGGAVSSGYKLDTNGKLYRASNKSTTPTWTDQADDWLTSGATSFCDVRITKTSGTVATMSGSVTSGTWYSLATSRLIGYSVSASGGVETGTFTVEIAAASDHSNILASCTLTLTATSVEYNPL